MTEQAPGYYRRAVGEFIVTALNDGFIDLPIEAFQGIEPQEMSALLTSRFRRPTPRASVNCFLVQGHGRTILIDAGAGDALGPTMGRLAANLAAAGVAAGDVDIVLMTHLHSDHTGGLCEADGRARFANAELAMSDAEHKFWLDDASLAGAPKQRRQGAEAARKATKPYQDRLRMLGSGSVIPGITPVALPGHTPGHTGYRIGDGEDSLLIWADLIRVQDVQGPRPGVSLVFDADPEQAMATRRRVLDMVAADRTAVAGMHLNFPGFHHVARVGGGYSLAPEFWSASAG